MLGHSPLKLLKPTHSHSENPLFIFLPGMDGTGQLLQNQANTLKQSFDLRCLAIPPDDLSHWDVLSLKVIDLIEAELRHKDQQTVYLCGESFGGCLALKMAVDAPSLFERLILVNPASCFNQRPWLSWGIHLTPWLPDWLHQSSTLGLLPFLASLERVSRPQRLALLKAMQSVPQSIVSWRLQLLKNFVLEDNHLDRLTQPTLLIAGAEDRLLPSVDEAKRLVNTLPNAELVVLPKSGHACLLETDIQLYDILKTQNFLVSKLYCQC